MYKCHFDTQEVFQKPVVGIIAGEAFEVNYRVGKFIAQLCPELFFVVFAPKLPDVYVNNLPSNLVFYTETEQFGTDPHLLPMLFNAMDICFFMRPYKVRVHYCLRVWLAESPHS